MVQVCSDCFGDGWGPMLRDVVWNTIEPPVVTMYILASQPDLIRWGRFLCEPCIEKRLGTPIEWFHLRDCPMNVNHPKYKPHDMEHWE